MGQGSAKGLLLKPPASVGVTNVSFVLTLVPDLSIILYLLELSAGVPGCRVTLWPQSLLIWVSPVPVVTPGKFLITLNFLSEETSGVFVPGVTFVPGLLFFCSKAVPRSNPNTLLSVGQFAKADGCCKHSQQAPGFLGKNSHFTVE